MGRTNPTYRDAIGRLEADCRPFQRALRRQYQADFDRLFDHGRDYADAAGHYNAADPEFAFVLSVLLAQEVQLRELRERVDAIDAAEGVDAVDGDEQVDDGEGVDAAAENSRVTTTDGSE
jgi:hypothetical protein